MTVSSRYDSWMTPSLTSPVKSGVRVSGGPLTAHIASYRAKLEELRYTPAQVDYHLRIFAMLDLWLLRRRERLWGLNEQKVGQFLARLHNQRPSGFRGARSGLRRLLSFLRDVGVVASKSEPLASTSSQRLAASVSSV